MKVLICLDVDGTLDTSDGPVAIAHLDTLRDCGASIVVVSPSIHWPSDHFPWMANAQRRDNLSTAKAAFPSDLLLYVSNNKDYEEAAAAGFTYIEASEFR